jgi:hypothetical protein
MRTRNVLLTSAAAALGFLFLTSTSFAKTAKDCTAEWRADKAGMQSRGVTEKAYVDQCKGSDSAPAATPSATKPSAAAPSASPKSSSAESGKTAKDCTAEWRADKAGMQARGVTEKSYVDQCKEGGAVPAAAAPPQPTKPSATAPATQSPSTSSSSQKTAKDCVAEWRADKAGMQARGVTEKAYVETCKTGAAPTANAPEPKPTVAPAAQKQAAPASTQTAPVPPSKPPVTTSAPTPPTRTPSTTNGPTLETGQFADEAPAKARCPTDTVVWVNLKSKIYHFTGTKSYGTTERGAYMCEKEAVSGENRAAKNEKHP